MGEDTLLWWALGVLLVLVAAAVLVLRARRGASNRARVDEVRREAAEHDRELRELRARDLHEDAGQRRSDPRGDDSA